MEISDKDLKKVSMIRIHERVNCLLEALLSIDKHSLMEILNDAPPDMNDTTMYRVMIHTLEFYNRVEKDLNREEQNE